VLYGDIFSLRVKQESDREGIQTESTQSHRVRIVVLAFVSATG